MTELYNEEPGVSGSILEGLDEILTIIRLGLPHELRRSLACTNIIENALGTVRQVTRNVKRWRNAEMALRWTAAGLLEAQKTFPSPQGLFFAPRNSMGQPRVARPCDSGGMAQTVCVILGADDRVRLAARDGINSGKRGLAASAERGRGGIDLPPHHRACGSWFHIAEVDFRNGSRNEPALAGGCGHQGWRERRKHV